MSYSPCDYMDDVNRALGLSMDTDDVRAISEAAINLIRQLQAKQPQMSRLLYYVSPVTDQLDWDNDGPVDKSLFVWATDASEAIKLWRDYYDLDDDEAYTIGVADKVRVHEVPIMPAGASSLAIGWTDIHTYGPTVTERVEI